MWIDDDDPSASTSAQNGSRRALEISSPSTWVPISMPRMPSSPARYRSSHGRLGVLHWYGAERKEPAGIAGGGFDELLVDDPGGLGAQLGIRPVVVLVNRDGDRLDVDAHPVHVGDTDVEDVHLGS